MRNHLTNKDLYCNIPKSSASIREQRLRFCGHSWRNKKEFISDVLLWEPIHGRKPGRPRKYYISKLIEDTDCTSDELRTPVENRDVWKQRAINNWYTLVRLRYYL